MHPVHISVGGVSFEFPNGRVLFTDLNFSLEAGRLTALVGPNGAGKTCLARLLIGELEPTAGAVRRGGPVTFFPQRLEPPSLTVADFLGPEYAWSVLGEQLLEGLDRQALCTTLSGGQWMRVRLACVLGDGFLILDEPTNDLDREGREALLRFLRDRSGGALLISHDRECLGLCEEVLELSNRGLARFGGDWRFYEEAKEHERQGLTRALDVAKRERDAAHTDRVGQLARQDKRNRRAATKAKRGGMPKILIGGRKRRAEVTTGKVDLGTMDRLGEAVREAHDALSAVKVDPVMYAGLMGQALPAQRLVLEARGFNVRYPGRDWLYGQDLEFAWRGNVRLALKGANGSGKSTLLKLLMGHALGAEVRGELRTGGLKTLYLDQRCAGLDDTRSILENVRDGVPGSEGEVRDGLARFLFRGETVFQKAAQLSGGERLRAALARGLLAFERPELLVLDEPTNNLDLANVEFLEGLVREFRGALVVVSHDQVFLENCGVMGEQNF